MKAQIWQGVVEGPGVYLGMPMDEYRGDPCPAPSLNNSIAKKLLFQSPLHGKIEHPRLVGDASPTEDDEDDTDTTTRAMDIGSAAHRLAFGVGEPIALIHAKNFKTKDAQQAKKAARAAGEIPLLPKEYRVAEAMADIARPVINELLGGSRVAEAVVIQRTERGFWRRGRVDRARADFRVVLDYKTTKRIASPAEAKGLVYSSGAYFQEGFYRPMLDDLDPDGAGRRRFCFLYQEQDPPWTLCLIETDEAGRTLAAEQVEAACNLWERGLVTGEWPGYPLGPHIASPPPWLIDRWVRRAETDESLNPYIAETEWAR